MSLARRVGTTLHLRGSRGYRGSRLPPRCRCRRSAAAAWNGPGGRSPPRCCPSEIPPRPEKKNKKHHGSMDPTQVKKGWLHQKIEMKTGLYNHAPSVFFFICTICWICSNQPQNKLPQDSTQDEMPSINEGVLHLKRSYRRLKLLLLHSLEWLDWLVNEGPDPKKCLRGQQNSDMK